jgi:hypothetical protein
MAPGFDDGGVLGAAGIALGTAMQLICCSFFRELPHKLFLGNETLLDQELRHGIRHCEA